MNNSISNCPPANKTQFNSEKVFQIEIITLLLKSSCRELEPNETSAILSLIRRLAGEVNCSLSTSLSDHHEAHLTHVLPLDTVTYKAKQVKSLYAAILDKAAQECSSDLLNTLGIASDLTSEIWLSLEKYQEGEA